MGIDAGPIEVVDGLVFHIDAGNSRSYSGSGLTVNGLVGIGGTLINGVGFGSTNSGYLIFDGTNDWMPLSFDSSFDISSSITIESVIYATSYKSGGGLGSFIIAKPASYYLELASNGKIRVYFYSLSSEGYHESTSTVSLNTWTYVAVTRNNSNSTINIYINGLLDRTLTAITGNIRVQQSYPVMIGSFQGSDYQLFGRFSFGKIYNRALSDQEIQQNYNATKGRYK